MQTMNQSLGQTEDTTNSLANIVWSALFLGVWLGTSLIGQGVVIFREYPDRLLVALPYAYAALGLVGAAFFILYTRGRRAGSGGGNRWLRWLALLPLGAMPFVLFMPRVGMAMHMFGAPLFLALAVSGMRGGRWAEGERPGGACPRCWVALFMVASGLYCMLGLWVTGTVGEHGGDEGHYLVQAQSLHDDGDLDLRNNLGMVEPGDLADVAHISPASRGGRWYSFHFSVLCFLLAPTWGHALIWRHGVLGLLGGLGVAGVYLLGCALGASRRSSMLSAILMGGSTFWVIYSCRALPEVLGATVAVYGGVAIAWQKRYPWQSALLGMACIGVLPWVYIRFAPLAVMLGGLYGLASLTAGGGGRSRLRLLVAALGVLTAWLAFAGIQSRMYAGGTVAPVASVFMADPSGVWQVLVSSRGVLVACPVFLVALINVLVLLKDQTTRGVAAGILLCFAGIWLTSCTARDWWGGATLPGRFLLVTLPLLMAGLAVALDRAPSGVRFMAFYPGFFSINILGYLLASYPAMKSLQGPLMAGDFHGLLTPLPRLLNEPGSGFPWLVVAGALLVLWLWGRPGLAQRGSVILVSAGVVGAVGLVLNAPVPRYYPLWTAQKWERIAPRRAFLWAFGDRTKPVPLLDHSNLCRQEGWPRGASEVSGHRALQVNTGGRISYPRIESNGWGEHPEYRWATLMDPLPVGGHDYALRIKAEVQGTSDIELAVRVGGVTRIQRGYKAGAHIDETMAFSVGARTRVYILMRFVDPAEEDRLLISSLEFSPFVEKLAHLGHLSYGVRETLPPERPSPLAASGGNGL